MAFRSINPANGNTLGETESFTATQLEAALNAAAVAAPAWRARTLAERCQLLREAAAVLRRRATELARLVTLEMGKPITEARAEVEKSALGCEYYAARIYKIISGNEHPLLTIDFPFHPSSGCFAPWVR